MNYQVFSLFQMPLTYLLRGRINLVSRGFSDTDIDSWEFWRFQYIITEIILMNKEKENTGISLF